MLVMECSEELFSSDSLMQLFFFKQRAAYGMRISDWSSDVCSSDLPGQRIAEPAQPGPRQAAERGGEQVEQPGGETGHAGECSERMRVPRAGGLNVRGGGNDGAKARSEEHTSELQSLMRTSYAVFCLKKTNCISEVLYPTINAYTTQ